MGLLKRKRSESELSFSSTSTLSSPPRPGFSSFHSFSATPSHLPSRTRKRFRDGRPSAEEVHHNTLKMLYSAQQQCQYQQQPQHHLQAGSMTVPQPVTTTRPISTAQRSLHAFWNISSSASSSSSSSASSSEPGNRCVLAVDYDRTSCEDCGVALVGQLDDMTMDVDEYQGQCEGACAVANPCVACGKVVCGSCSISNLGADPRCLVCAGPRAGGDSEPRADAQLEMFFQI